MSEQKEMKFPEGFYWGAATASYQVEGGIENTDWAQAARAGIVPAAGKLADHYRLYEKDFDIAKELGHNAHRFSIEWARIEPTEGEFSSAEIEHYRKVLLALRTRDIEPFVTLWHFTLPQWFADKGGFEHPDAPKLFARYCEFVVSELGDLCTHFSTINEPNIYSALGWLRGAWPPFKRFSLASASKQVSAEHRASESRAKKSVWAPLVWWQVVHSLIRAHNQAYSAIKRTQPHVCVSIVKHVHVYDSSWWPQHVIMRFFAHYFLNAYFMNRVYKHCDEIGLNYYRYTKFGDRQVYKKTDMGWNQNPAQIEAALLFLKQYKKPVYVSEAGIADADDSDRAEYMKEQVRGVARAIERGVDVRGYMYWSLIDNYEWDLGTEKQFGLVAIDYETLERTIRPSAYVYKKICERNAVV